MTCLYAKEQPAAVVISSTFSHDPAPLDLSNSRHGGDRADVLDEVHEVSVGVHGDELGRAVGVDRRGGVGLRPGGFPAALRRIHVLRGALELRRCRSGGNFLPEGKKMADKKNTDLVCEDSRQQYPSRNFCCGWASRKEKARV